jgi:hypothetical protein
MSLNQFFLDVGFQLQEFIWRDVPQKSQREQIDQLEYRICQGTAALARGRAVIEELRYQVAQKERRESWLASRVEVYLHVADQANAWRHALELDRLRTLLKQERERLKRRRQTYREQQAYLEKIQEELANLHQEAYLQRG